MLALLRHSRPTPPAVLFERACRVMRDGIRHQHPNLDDAGVLALLRERLDRVSALERS